MMVAKMKVDRENDNPMGYVVAKYYFQDQIQLVKKSLAGSRFLEGLSPRISQDDLDSSLIPIEAEYG